MNFACHQCERRYSIADEKVRGRTVKVRCKSCQTVLVVQGPMDEPEESTRALSRVDLERLRDAERALSAVEAPPGEDVAAAGTWFIMVRGAQEGPLTDAQLEDAVSRGDLNARTFCWQEGMADWKRASEIPELATRLPAPAAAPPRPVTVAPTPAPPPPRAMASDSPPLQSLFDDVEGLSAAASRPTAGAMTPIGPIFGAARGRSKKKDPFAQVESDPAATAAPPGEETQFFMSQSGVNRRNPPWKIALSALLAVGLPVGLLWALSVTNVVPLTVKRVDAATGEEIDTPIFSSQGVAGLKERMLGRSPLPTAPEPATPPATAAARPPAAAGITPAKGTRTPEDDSGAAQAAALYALDEKQDVGPVARRAAAVTSADSSGSEGPPPENIAKVVGDRQAAFQGCVEQELRRNPAFRGGRVGLTVTVGSSGAVKGTSLDRRDLDTGRVGECLKSTARKMVFASFNGDEVQVVIPLVLTRAD